MEYLVWYIWHNDKQLKYAVGLGPYGVDDNSWTSYVTKATRYSLKDALDIYKERTTSVDTDKYQIGLTRDFTTKDSPTMDIPGPKEWFNLLEQQWIEKGTK